MVKSGSLATLIQPFAQLTWTVPDEWSLQEAATVPVIYFSVYCAFFLGKSISAEKSILIHAGCGEIGLAAIQVALAYDMIVFTTVANTMEKHYIAHLFPNLKGNS